MATQIGGPHVTVRALVKGTQDPHFVEAKPSMTLELNRADLLLVVGLELEAGWLPPLATGARNPAVLPGGRGYLDCSTLVELTEVPSGAPDRAHGDIHPGGNPHYWTDPRNMARIARGVAARLQELDGEHAAHYQAGLASFLERLRKAMARWEGLLAPHRGTKVVVFHRSWSYFLRWSGLVAVGELEPKPGIEPSPSHVAGLIGRVRGQSVRLVLQEAFYPRNLSKVFAAKAGARLLVVPTMAGAAGTDSYIHMMDHLVDTIVGGLQGR